MKGWYSGRKRSNLRLCAGSVKTYDESKLENVMAVRDHSWRSVSRLIRKFTARVVCDAGFGVFDAEGGKKNGGKSAGLCKIASIGCS